jgi:3-hydroxyacyl-CoA dehydrogenase
MFYADSLGLGNVLEVLRGYERAYGAEWKPAALLESLAREGKGFVTAS